MRSRGSPCAGRASRVSGSLLPLQPGEATRGVDLKELRARGLMATVDLFVARCVDYRCDCTPTPIVAAREARVLRRSEPPGWANRQAACAPSGAASPGMPTCRTPDCRGPGHGPWVRTGTRCNGSHGSGRQLSASRLQTPYRSTAIWASRRLTVSSYSNTTALGGYVRRLKTLRSQGSICHRRSGSSKHGALLSHQWQPLVGRMQGVL